jgi:hypothetical protein
MGAYNCDLGRTADTTNGVAVYQPASALKRIRIGDVIWGNSGTPADAAYSLAAQRSTAAPSGGTAVTPQPLDPADGAASGLSMDGAVTNGTLTANAFLLNIVLNQRSTFRWVAREGKELVIPSTNANGIHFLTPVGTALAIQWGIHIEE